MSTFDFQRCLHIFHASLAILLLATLSSTGAVFVVTTTDDSGAGSLRQAILDANGNAGPDTIHFNIPGVGVQTISPQSALPAIFQPVTIDGYTQPGASPNSLVDSNNAVLLIELDGSNAGADTSGLVVFGGCTIRGLVINRFTVAGILDADGGTNVFEGNFVGTDPTGTLDRGNGGDGIYSPHRGNRIGGSSPASRNVVSGNGGHGMTIGDRNIVQGNFVGTSSSGRQPLGNNGIGVWVPAASTATQVEIGGADPGVGNVVCDNLHGIVLGGMTNAVLGNLVGVDVTGTVALGNRGDGLVIHGPGHLVGGPQAGAQNVFAANQGHGIAVIFSVSVGNRIFGNIIGLSVDGTAALGNGGAGIAIGDGSQNVVGGPNAGEGNVIAANLGHGVQIWNPPTVSNVIQGNFIGTDLSGSLNFGNRGDGINISGDARNNFIGGEGPALGNVIAFNLGTGVFIGSSNANAVLGNSIHANGARGIDLGYDGITFNDPGDLDSGPNNLQNFPSISLVVTAANVTRVEGTLQSRSNTLYRLELFASDAADPSGYGEGQVFIGATNVLAGADGNASFIFEAATNLPSGAFVTATATDPQNNTSEFSQARAVPFVAPPPSTRIQPASTNVALGSSVTFCAEIQGDGPFQIQWRHNGVNLTDETNACLTIEDVQLPDGGAYTVVVGNSGGAVLSDPAFLRLEVPAMQGGDELTDRTTIIGPTGLLSGTNVLAGSDPNEPRHFGKPGGKSIWYQWRPANTGIATFQTAGSTFDTLLAIYVECSPSNLVEVASDEDNGGNLTSLVRYNAIAGTNYLIVVDGFGGAEGEFALSWSFEQTTDLLPVISMHPKNLTVAPEDAATFSVEAIAPAVENHYQCMPAQTTNSIGLTYQWFLNGVPIAGATNSSLTRPSVLESDLGNYTVKVSSSDRVVESRPASLQINLTGNQHQNVQAQNKFEDAAEGAAIELGRSESFSPPGHGPVKAAGIVVRGYTGTQVFNTAGGTTEPNDQPVCGVIGGASQWITFVMRDTGVLYLNSDGSSYDTVLAVFARSPANPALLHMVACDSNSGLDGRDSALSLPVQAGSTNFIMVDGVNGATGTLRLNYSLVTRATFTALYPNAAGDWHLTVNGQPGMRLQLEASADMTNWTVLVRTNSSSGLLDYLDTTARSQLTRFYRAAMLPW